MTTDRQTPGPPTADAPPAAPSVPRLTFSMAEAAEAVGVSRRGLYNLAARDGLPTVKLGGRRLVRVADLREWIAARPVDPAGQETSREALHGVGTSQD